MGFFGSSYFGYAWFGGATAIALGGASVAGQISAIIESSSTNVAGQVADVVESASAAIDGRVAFGSEIEAEVAGHVGVSGSGAAPAQPFFGLGSFGRSWFGIPVSGDGFNTVADVWGQLADTTVWTEVAVAGQVAQYREFGSFSLDGQAAATMLSASTNLDGQVAGVMESASTEICCGYIWSNYQGLGAIGSANAIDLTNRMYGADARGFDLKIKAHNFPGSKRVVWNHQGIDGPMYKFGTGYASGYQASRDLAFALVDAFSDVDGDTTECRFYPRDSLWWHKAKYAEATPQAAPDTWDFWLNCNVWLIDPYLYYDISEAWAVSAGTLPQTSAAMTNHGSVDDCFESLAVTGHHNGTNHVEDLVLSIAGGDSMTLSNHLLDGEIITLERTGKPTDSKLTTSWTATLSSLAAFQVDASTSGTVTFSGDHISIAASSSAVVILSGPYPTKESVKMTANLTITGTASVQISTDAGATYTDSVTNANIESGSSAVYYLTGTGRADDIYVKFNCPSASTMLIHSLKLERVLDCSGATLPKVAHGSNGAFTVPCDVTKSTTATIAATYRARRWPV